MTYDNTLKYLVEQYPEDFIRYLLASEATDIQILKTELNQEPIRADSVTFLQTANQILHLEFQTLPASTPPLPLRMLDYWVRLYRQYNCDIEQIVIRTYALYKCIVMCINELEEVFRLFLIILRCLRR